MRVTLTVGGRVEGGYNKEGVVDYTGENISLPLDSLLSTGLFGTFSCRLLHLYVGKHGKGCCKSDQILGVFVIVFWHLHFVVNESQISTTHTNLSMKPKSICSIALGE